MNIQNFIKNFSEQFERTEASVFNPDTVIRELEEWSSIIALSVVAMVDEEYGVNLSSKDIRNAVTVGDLYELVRSKVQ